MWFSLLKTPIRSVLCVALAAGLLGASPMLGLTAEPNTLPTAQTAQSAAATGLAVPPTTAAEVDARLAETVTVSFRKRFQAVLDDAWLYLVNATAAPGTAAVVLDLDETLMDNRAYFIRHKVYNSTVWDQWVAEGEAAAIPETLAFLNWLNSNGFKVYFVSGRKESLRGVTEKNLHEIGAGRYAGLFLKPDNYSKDSASDFKIEARKAIEAKGEHIFLLLGDQASDLRGGHGDRGFLLPNPIYQIP